jgi:glycosyltransferase involved in cell wall biosynthesis
LNGDRWASILVAGLVDRDEGDMGYFAEDMQVAPVVIPELGRRVKPLDDMRAVVKLYRLLRRECPDIIHTHTAKAGGLGRLAALAHNACQRLARRGPARVIHTFHGHLFHGYFSPPVARLLVFAERAMARVTDRIVTVSDSVKRDLVDRYRICHARKVTIVPLGFDFDWVCELDARRGLVRDEYGVPASAVVIGVVGRLTEVKNHELLLQAMASLPRDDVRLLVIGDGALRPQLEKRSRELGLEGAVRFTGWQRDPARIYAALDIVALTSKNEGTPVALVEAMAAGKPFVATRVGGIVDLVQGEGVSHPAGFEAFANGLLVPPGRVGPLVAALDHLVRDPDRRRAMGAAGQADVHKWFGKERLLSDMEDLYDELLADRRAVECAR